MKSLAFHALMLALAACASAPKAPPRIAGDLNNAYFKSLKDAKPALGSQALPILRLAPQVFDSDMKAVSVNGGVLSKWPDVWSFDEFIPLDVRASPSSAEILFWDKARLMPWWWDLVQMETSALVIAADESLRNYREGACLEGYQEALVFLTEGIAFTETATLILPAPTPAIKDERPATDEKIAAAFMRVVPAGRSIVDARLIGTDVGHEADLATLDDGSKIEFRENADCKGFLELARIFRPGLKSQCLTTGGRHFGVWPIPAGATSPQETDFSSESALASQARWMCRELAHVHAGQWPRAKQMELRLMLERHRAIVERLKAYARNEAQSVVMGYRTLLEDAALRAK